MTTPIFDVDELIANQSQPHVPVNSAIRKLEAIVSKRVLDKDLSTPPGSPAEGDRYIVGPSPTGDWAGRADQIAYYSGGWSFIQPETGWTVSVVDEAAEYVYSFGSPSGWALVSGSSGTNPYIVALYAGSAPTAGEVLVAHRAPVAFTLPASLTDSQARAGTPATSASVFSIRKNGTEVGTITFGSGSPQDVGTFSFASLTSFAIGDELSIVAPAVADSTIAGIAISLKGTR